MHYNRETVNLIFEIKRSLPIDRQEDFKISAPDLLEKVSEIYLSTKKESTRSLAKKFLNLAGVDASSMSLPNSNILTRLYRGVETPIEVVDRTEVKVKKERMYRGQLVLD